MPDDLELRRRIYDILRSAPCQKVDFGCGGLHVSGAGFSIIAHAVSQGGVDGKGIQVIFEKPLETTYASYDPARNAIMVSNREWGATDRFERYVTVHEATHAWRDFQGKQLIYEGRVFRPRGATEEATAYVAGALYDVYVQREAGRTPEPRPAWLDSRVMSPANALAYEIALRQEAKPAGSAVDREDLSALFAAVTAYRRKTLGEMPRYYDGYDGIPL